MVDAINSTEAAFWLKPGVLTRRLGPIATVAVGDPVVATANRYADGCSGSCTERQARKLKSCGTGR